MVTILLVEDNNAIRENTVELLEMEGYRVITAMDGKDGFDKTLQHLPDIIVCDILMPKMDGLTLLKKLGRYHELKGIPLIFFSSKSAKNDINEAMAAGAEDFIVKPSDMTDLFRAIERCLERLEKIKNA